MRNLSWKIGFALMTFFVGTVLVLILILSSDQSSEIVKAQSRPSEIEIIKPEDKIPKPPSESKFPKSHNSKNSSSIHRIKDSGKFCEKYLLKKIAKEKSVSNQIIKLKNFNVDDETLLPNVKKWLEYMRKDELLTVELRNNQQKALLLSSTSYGATGLATSLENWHIEIDDIYSGEFWSFSKNPNLIFWDKDGLLNYYSVIYSDDFLSATSDRNYNNLTFNIERYKISLDGKTQLISEEQNLSCE